MSTDVGARRLAQVVFGLMQGHVSSNLTNKVSKSDWKFATPVFQSLPTEGSPAPRPMYSTVSPPELVDVTWVRTPGASKFSYPILGPVSSVAAGGGTGISGTALAVPV